MMASIQVLLSIALAFKLLVSNTISNQKSQLTWPNRAWCYSKINPHK